MENTDLKKNLHSHFYPTETKRSGLVKKKTRKKPNQEKIKSFLQRKSPSPTVQWKSFLGAIKRIANVLPTFVENWPKNSC